MSASLICLFGLIAWAMVLLTVVLGARIAAVVGQGHEPNIFAQDGSDLTGLGSRITRAERNNLEWMVIPAALIVYGVATGQSAITDGLAMIVLYARLAQSIIHIISLALPAVLLRASLFTVQFVIWIIWLVGFAKA